jgi:MATE family multidrug resistance protein
MSTTGLAAQATGADDTVQAADVLTRSLIVGLALSLLILFLQNPLETFLLWYTNVSPINAAAGDDTELAGLVHVYFRTRVYGAPAVLANYAINGWLLGVKRSDLTLALQLLLNSTNIVLNLLFVVGFDWGVAGVAIATVAANWIGCIFGLALCRHCLNVSSQDATPKAYHNSSTHLLQHYGRLFHMNANIFIRSSCLTLCWLTVTQQGVKQGHSIVAANAILLVLQGFTSYALDGFANASEALVGGAIGAQSSEKLHSAIMTTTVQAFIVSLIFTATFAFFGPSLTLVLTSDSEVQEVLQR